MSGTKSLDGTLVCGECNSPLFVDNVYNEPVVLRDETTYQEHRYRIWSSDHSDGVLPGSPVTGWTCPTHGVRAPY